MFRGNVMKEFAGKTLLITGGTGSFGNAVLQRFLQTDIREIRIFSRDELKQDDMRHFYQKEYPKYSDKIKFYIGMYVISAVSVIPCMEWIMFFMRQR